MGQANYSPLKGGKCDIYTHTHNRLRHCRIMLPRSCQPASFRVWHTTTSVKSKMWGWDGDYVWGEKQVIKGHTAPICSLRGASRPFFASFAAFFKTLKVIFASLCWIVKFCFLGLNWWKLGGLWAINKEIPGSMDTNLCAIRIWNVLPFLLIIFAWDQAEVLILSFFYIIRSHFSWFYRVI